MAKLKFYKKLIGLSFHWLKQLRETFLIGVNLVYTVLDFAVWKAL